MAAFFIQFFLNLLDIGIFWYYLNTFHNKKRTPTFVCMPLSVLLAAVWAWVNSFGYPFVNLLVLAIVLSVLSFLFYGGLLQKVTGVIVFIGAGILVEPAGFIILQVLRYSPSDGEMYKYYFVAALGEIMRCGAIYLFCRAARLKGIKFSKLPADFIWPVLVVFVFAVMDCCFIVMVSLESGSAKSLVMCLCIIVSVILTYYLVFYMVERIAGLFEKQHEEEMYKEEMRYQEIYYRELEKRNEDMQVFKHDLKNKLIEMYRFFEDEDTKQLMERIRKIYQELDSADDASYSANPAVDSVLRLKIGKAKSEGIEMDVYVLVPKGLQLEYGDTGVLYGNLLDNAIEACQKVEQGKRYIHIENKYIDGKMLLVIENSKPPAVNEKLRTTKQDSYQHGRGIASVRKVVGKYNGTVVFSDKGDCFEAAVMLYGIEAGQ